MTHEGTVSATTSIRVARLAGRTYPIRHVLRREGWSWDPVTSTWIYSADWADVEEVRRVVNLYIGIHDREMKGLVVTLDTRR